MKKIFLIIALLFSSFFFINSSNAGFFDDMTSDTKAVSPYCQGDGECSLSAGINITKGGITDIEKDRKASEYVQDIVGYALKFISIIAIIYIIYAGFGLLTSAGDEEKQKKTKNIIVFVIIGIVVIWMASPILVWLLEVLNQSK